MDGSTWSREREAWHSRHFTASSSQALILRHEKTSRPIGNKPWQGWWLLMSSRGRYPHLPKKLTYQAPPAREGPPNPTRTHSSSHTRGCFRCEGFVLGRVFFCSFKNYKDFTRTRIQIQGAWLTGKELKANRSLGDLPFLHGIEQRWGFLLLW